MHVYSSDQPTPQATSQFEFEDLLSIKEILAILQRHRLLILICIVIGLIGGMIYIFFAEPRYTASTSILLDPRQQDMLPDVLSRGFTSKNQQIIDSQIEVIRSDKLLEKAATQAGVFTDLSVNETSFFGSIKEMFVGPKDPKLVHHVAERKRQALLNSFSSGLQVDRVRKTFVINISYTSTNAEMSAKRANLIAEVYLEDELEAQYEAAQRTNAWVKTRLKVLQKELSDAERAVEQYKEQHNLQQSNGRVLLSDQQMSNLQSDLIAARAKSAEAKAKYERILEIVQQGDANVSTADLLQNSVITNLRSKYFELSRMATEIKRNQGEEHQAYLNLKQQMQDIQAQIMQEYKHIAESYKSAHELAKLREASLIQELEAVKGESSIDRRNQIELRELQRRAESTRNLYTKLLDDFKAQTERQLVPAVNARIISYASIPPRPSWPNTQYILLVSLVLGAAAGIGLAFLREQFDKFIWKAEEIEAVTHRTCLGMLPKIAFDGAKLGKLSKAGIRMDASPVHKGDIAGFNVEGFNEVTQLLNKQTGVTTEIMRNIQLAVQFRKDEVVGSPRSKVISFVSARPGEGKSITSCFLARHLAKGNARVALIDCDFRRPSLTHWFYPNAERGFYEVASSLEHGMDEATIQQEIEAISQRAGDDPLYFIPAKGANTSIANLNLVSSGQMHQLIQHLQKHFDAILIDLPPIINIVDARVVAGSIDCFVFLAHWGRTDRELVKKALLRAPEVYNKTVGTLLTLVDTEKAGSYGYYNYNYYYQR